MKECKLLQNMWLGVSLVSILLMILIVGAFLWWVWSDVTSIRLYAAICVTFLTFIVTWMLNCEARKNYRTSWRLQEAHRHKQMFRDSMASVLSGGDGTGGLKGIDYRLAEMIIENLADDPSKHMFE